MAEEAAELSGVHQIGAGQQPIQLPAYRFGRDLPITFGRRLGRWGGGGHDSVHLFYDAYSLKILGFYRSFYLRPQVAATHSYFPVRRRAA